MLVNCSSHIEEQNEHNLIHQFVWQTVFFTEDWGDFQCMLFYCVWIKVVNLSFITCNHMSHHIQLIQFFVVTHDKSQLGFNSAFQQLASLYLKEWIWRSYQCIMHTKLYETVKFGCVSLKKYQLYQKCFKQKFRINFPTKKSVRMYVYLSQEWNWEGGWAWKIVMFEIL